MRYYNSILVCGGIISSNFIFPGKQHIPFDSSLSFNVMQFSHTTDMVPIDTIRLSF